MIPPRKPSTPDRLNHAIESRMDSLALVILLYNDSGIKIDERLAPSLDELGHMLLHNLKIGKKMTSEELVKYIAEYTAKMEALRNVPRT